MSLPKQTKTWAATKAGYRLLSNPKVCPHAIQGPHRLHTRESCGEHPLVLCVQDTSEIDFTSRKDVKGLGKIGTGHGRGFEQHSTLAILPSGSVLGILDQHWCLKPDPPEGETRTQMENRWNMGDLWPDAVARVGSSPKNCRFIHVADRGGDNFKMMRACIDNGVGFLLRSKSDRYVEGHSTRLWKHARGGALAGTKVLRVSRQNAKPSGRARTAQMQIQYRAVQLDAPYRGKEPVIQAWAVLVSEVSPPQGEWPIEWLLITNEPLNDAAAALAAVGWYEQRWVIEEWHKGLKSICGLERSQLDDAADLQRLASILGVVAVWLLQLRDAAHSTQEQAQDPAALRQIAPPIWIQVVAKMSGQSEETMTPHSFLLAIAKRGGFLGRKSDGNPGWKTIYLGWVDFARMVEFAEATANSA